MPITLISPTNETPVASSQPPARLKTLRGATIALLDISKPGGSIFLDRLASLLKQEQGVHEIVRIAKPTFAKPAPAAILDQLSSVDAVIEALAD